ncbi:MAG: DUF971 domain-containing protein [Verrucomicrobiota bacterium]|nr:DUF971 domain-containing protein [Verrucomicrobiota bacterium]
MLAPTELQVIGNELAVRWSDGREDFIRCEDLRAASPSAENIGEPDIFGRWRGGTAQKTFPGVTVTTWEFIGQYAVRFVFSDGHGSGLYSYAYLRQLVEAKAKGQAEK